LAAFASSSLWKGVFVHLRETATNVAFADAVSKLQPSSEGVEGVAVFLPDVARRARVACCRIHCLLVVAG
jgi:hypothetical protein